MAGTPPLQRMGTISKTTRKAISEMPNKNKSRQHSNLSQKLTPSCKANQSGYGQLIVNAEYVQKKRLLVAEQKASTARKAILGELHEKLEKPTVVSVGATDRRTSKGQKSEEKRPTKLSKLSKADPIQKVIRVNDKVYKFNQAMNETLLKILERYDLDKPILMSDKLDIIWDKAEKTEDQGVKKKEVVCSDPEEEYQRVLRKSTMSAEEAFKERSEAKKKRNDEIRENLHKTDNVNQYAVKHKLEKKKVYRSQMNAKQQQAYQKLLDVFEQRFAPRIGNLTSHAIQ